MPGASAGGVTWTIDNLENIGGHAVTVVGSPRVVDTPGGRALEFNGTSDGLLIDANPLAGLAQFTIDIEFKPAADGQEEQRFLHFEENGSGNRALIELRMNADRRWALDTFLRSPEPGLTLLDRTLSHPSDVWHTATLSYDGRTMAHFVDGVRELAGEVAFTPLGPGRTSIGMRQNRVSWFKGQIRSVRITPSATRVIPLWPEGVPNAQPKGGEERVEEGRVYNVHRPTLTYYPPTAPPNGTAVIVCPGGGYVRLAIGNEGGGVASVLRPQGVAVFVLKYRLAEYGFPAPLQDVLRAVRLLRSRAREFGIRPDRIGVFGASAGGHVAAMAATMFDVAEGRTGHALDAVDGRPDFISLLYPVITMDGAAVHAGSRRGLLGDAPPAPLVERLSLERRVTSRTPPAFLVHTAEDKSVPLENSVLFYQALRRAGVPAEMHLYEKGEHGFGLRRDLGPTSEWPRRWIEWMTQHGWLPPAPAKFVSRVSNIVHRGEHRARRGIEKKLRGAHAVTFVLT